MRIPVVVNIRFGGVVPTCVSESRPQEIRRDGKWYFCFNHVRRGQSTGAEQWQDEHDATTQLGLRPKWH